MSWDYGRHAAVSDLMVPVGYKIASPQLHRVDRAEISLLFFFCRSDKWLNRLKAHCTCFMLCQNSARKKGGAYKLWHVQSFHMTCTCLAIRFAKQTGSTIDKVYH
jgi:hypothetical protein